MVATPKGVSRAIQRIGRSGHSLDRNSHGVLVATNINDLVEATVTAKLVRERALDPIKIQEKPYDVVAQHVVGLAAVAPIAADEAFVLVRRAYPFRDLTREEFERVLEYLEGGGAALQREYAGVFGKIRVDDGLISLAHPRIAREFLVNIGTIHDFAIDDQSWVGVLDEFHRFGQFLADIDRGNMPIAAARKLEQIGHQFPHPLRLLVDDFQGAPPTVVRRRSRENGFDAQAHRRQGAFQTGSSSDSHDRPKAADTLVFQNTLPILPP